MNFHINKLPFLRTFTFKKLLFLALALSFFTTVPFYVLRYPHSPLASLRIKINSLETTGIILRECDIFTGKWVHHQKRPHYTNETCSLITPEQNCMKFGRPDRDYLQWRWRPDRCELPLFDTVKFLEFVRGKSVAFVGDSVARNQMQSLSCLLAREGNPKDVSRKFSTDKRFQRWEYTNYNFTLAAFWSPFLVKAVDADRDIHNYERLINLHLDQADEKWVSQIEGFDYVIISAGQWFFGNLRHYRAGKAVACHKCLDEESNVTAVDEFYGYRMALRTALEALRGLKGFDGVTFVRTYSPQHFEHGPWNGGGSCGRTRPFVPEEVTLDGNQLKFYSTQVEELRRAEERGRRKGLKFLLLAITELMLLRPDGHPNRYGHPSEANVSIADCVLLRNYSLRIAINGERRNWEEDIMYIPISFHLQLAQLYKERKIQLYIKAV